MSSWTVFMAGAQQCFKLGRRDLRHSGACAQSGLLVTSPCLPLGAERVMKRASSFFGLLVDVVWGALLSAHAVLLMMPVCT